MQAFFDNFFKKNEKFSREQPDPRRGQAAPEGGRIRAPLFIIINKEFRVVRDQDAVGGVQQPFHDRVGGGALRQRHVVRI